MALVFCVIVLGCAAAVRVHDRFFSGVLRVTFFDVGQGDAVLVRFPRGTVWLVDAGGGWKDWDRGRDLLPELARMSIGKIDVAVLSHPDTDHGLGFRGLWGGVAIQEFWWNAVFNVREHALLQQLLPLAAQFQTRALAKRNPFSLGVDGAVVQVWPLPRSPSKNESPLAIWVEFAGCRFLLAGDAERKAERLFVASVEKSVDVLKVNHHGSRSSSAPEFLDWAKPLWAVASVGSANRYGHPAQEVERRFAQRQMRYLRTDIHGFVEFTVYPGGKLKCASAEGPCGDAVCGGR